MKKKCILVCDDSARQRNALTGILSKRYDVRESRDYRNLVAELGQIGTVQLLILDLNFENDNVEYGAVAVLPELARSFPSLKIVIYSSILADYAQRKKAEKIARDLLRYPQVVSFLSSADGEARIDFEIGKALGTPEWLDDDEINLLHVSDVQFGGKGPLPNPEDLAARITEAVVNWVQGERSRNEDRTRRYPEVVILSGDLTQRGRPDEFALALRFAKCLTQFVATQANHMAGLIPPSNLVVVPGNHDVNWDLSRARSLFSGVNAVEYRQEINQDSALKFLQRHSWLPFCEATALYSPEAREWAWEPGYKIIDLRREIRLIIACVNSARYGVTHLSDVGAVSNETWRQVQRDLNLLDPKRVYTRILVIHHSLSVHADTANCLKLADNQDEHAQLIEQISNSCGFCLVVTGHIHELAAHEIPTGHKAKKLVHVGAGSARSADTKPFRDLQFSLLRLCEIEKEKYGRVDVYPFKYDGTRFCAYSAFGGGQKNWEGFDLE